MRRMLVGTVLLLVCSTPLAAARLLALPSGTVTVEATGPTGAVYTFDEAGLTCDHHSGAMFPIGDTPVDCGTDGTFTVHVVDSTPPVVTPPPDVTVTTG